jgi:hypothetical protein
VNPALLQRLSALDGDPIIQADESERPELAEWLRRSGFSIVEWSGRGDGDPVHRLLRALVEQLDLVDVHAINWNAVSGEMQVMGKEMPRPVAILLERLDAIQAVDPNQVNVAFDFFRRRSREWRKRGYPLKVIVFEDGSIASAS